jgi:uncharacterized membrane protein
MTCAGTVWGLAAQMEFIILVAVAAVIIVLYNKIEGLNARIARLEANIGSLQVAPAKPATSAPPVWARPPAVSKAIDVTGRGIEEPATTDLAPVEVPVLASTEVPESVAPWLQTAPVEPPVAAKAAPPPRKNDIDWERTLGVRLPVWGGAIMLLIAGFFLINWAIEAGVASIFTPEVRVILCGLAAAGLLVSAFVVRKRGIANGDSIASALATSAIAVGYGTVFLAALVFHLVPGFAALIGASLVTAIAIAVAAQFDRRVMLVGLLGGYLSPFFVWSVGTSGSFVPYYVAILLAASFYAIRRFGWWGQAIPALFGPALWGLGLMFGTDPITLVVFYLSLAVIPAAIATIPLNVGQTSVPKRHDLILLGTLLSATLLLLGFIAHHSHPAFAVAQVLLSTGGCCWSGWTQRGCVQRGGSR